MDQILIFGLNRTKTQFFLFDISINLSLREEKSLVRKDMSSNYNTFLFVILVSFTLAGIGYIL